MRLIENFPLPSDRMGLMWSLLNISEAIVLEYGPAGTTHFSTNLYNSLGLELSCKLYTTHMSENDVVMGDVTKLEKSILELDSKFKPKIIFVVGSSTSAVIGTDLAGICAALQAKTQAKLIPFNVGGLAADYTQGEYAAAQTIIDYVIAKKDVQDASNQRTFNILGASLYRFREAANVNELARLLGEAFDLELNATLFYDSSVSKLEKLGTAAINIVTSKRFLALAKVLESAYGTPYLYVAPYGYKATIEMLEAVGEILAVKPCEKVLQRLQKKQRTFTFFFRMPNVRTYKQQKALLNGDADVVGGLERLLAEAGIQDVQNLCGKEESEALETFGSTHNTLVLADDVSLENTPADNTKVRIAYPLLVDNQVATHMPLIGEWGSDYLFEIIKEYRVRLSR